MTTTLTPTRTFTALALDAELGRRRNNKTRDEKVRAKGYVLPALSREDIANLKNGELVKVEFKSGRTEIVGLKG